MSEVKNTISYLTGVNAVQRKFALRRNTCYKHTLNSGMVLPGTTYIGGSVRSKHILGVGAVTSNVVFMRMAGGFAPQPSPLQLNTRVMFTDCSAWVRDARINITNFGYIKQCVADPSLKIGGKSPIGYTMNGFLWKYVKDYYDANQAVPSSTTLPQPA